MARHQVLLTVLAAKHDAIAWRDAAIVLEITRHPLDLLEQRPIRDGRAEVLDRRLVRIAARCTFDVVKHARVRNVKSAG